MIKPLTHRRWFYPLVYFVLILLSMLPPITEHPYDPRATQDVILSILMVSTIPYQAWGWVFHAATLALVLVIVFKPQKSGRLVAAYFGLNYLIIAGLQTHAITDQYGFAVHTGSLVVAALIGILWLVVALRGTLGASFKGVPPWRWFLLPLALLVFWSPVAVVLSEQFSYPICSRKVITY